MIPSQENIFLVMEMRRMGIANLKVMEAVEKIPLDAFPEEGFVNEIARANKPQSISRFLTVAILCDALNVSSNHKVLEIGTGSGYQTAVLAKLCRRIYSISPNKDAIKNAENIITNLGISNFTLMKADIEKGLENQAPIDRIIINNVFYKIPDIIKKQLKEGGQMIAPIGFPEGDNQVLKSFYLQNNEWIEKEIIPIKFIYP